MGKKLIIKGADFSANAIDREYVEVDLTQYTKLHTSIGVSSSSYPINEDISTIDSYIIPVNEGEVYKLQTCTGDHTIVAAILTSDHIERASGNCTNIADVLIISDTNPFLYNGEFIIPTNGYLYIVGRNSTHSGYNPNYPLTLWKM